MNKVLVYGDSNVWGDNFITGERIPDDKQWVKIIQKKLKKNYIFFQEGLPGRIAGNDETVKKYKNGKDTFISIFRTNAPVNTIIIALGTNDLQMKYNKSSKQIINDLLWYKEQIEKSYEDLEDRKKYFIEEKMPRIIYILPINFDYKVNASVIFNEESEHKRQEIIDYFSKNNMDIIMPSDMELFEDGIHMNFEDHKKLANIVEKELTDNE